MQMNSDFSLSHARGNFVQALLSMKGLHQWNV